MFFSPLAQFDIVQILPLRLFNVFDVSLSNGTLSMLSVIFIYLFFFSFFNEELNFVPTYWQLIWERIFMFVYKLVVDQIGYKGLQFFPYLMVIFLFILNMNLLSMLPYSFAMTTHVVFTLVFTISLLLGLLFLGFFTHGMKFMNLFIPDVPKALLVLMIPLEILSYLIRSFSLGIRLSANLLAGHTLLHILADMSQSISVFNLDISIFCLLLLSGIMVMELGVSCLQAYIFTLLVSIYINDVYNLSGH